MDAPLSSPHRGPIVTYLERSKKKRRRSPQSVSESDSDSNSISESFKSKKTTNPPMKTPAANKTSANNVDLSLPRPSPKRIRRESDGLLKSPSKSQKRSSSSVSSIKFPVKQPQTKKPESVSAPIRKGKLQSLAMDEDLDDSASVADSTLSNSRIRRNESERIEYFQNQDRCGKFEPHSAHCLNCKKDVNLGRKQTYAVRPWEIHRARCDQKSVRPVHAVPESVDKSSEIVHKPESFIKPGPPPSKPTPARRPNEAERKANLEGDKQIRELEKHRALCSRCEQWIDLSDTHRYANGNWIKHKKKCGDVIPSVRVAAAKRRLLLVNDIQAKSFTPHEIDCAFCGITVQLERDEEFNLSGWDNHKSVCTRSVPVSRSDSSGSITIPSRFSDPPPSSASTDDTLVIDHVAPHGTKRVREEAEPTTDSVDERPSVRPRTASYIPANIEPPNGVLGWFMLPLHSFVRGFKESLKDRS